MVQRLQPSAPQIPPKFPQQIPPMATPRKTAQGTWRIQIEVRGVRDSGTFPTAREARQWETDRTREILAELGGNAGSIKTLAQALRKFAEEESPKRRGERWELVRLKAFEGEAHSLPLRKPLGQITDDDLKAWRDRRLSATSRGTVLRDMALLSAVFEAARLEWKWIKANPLRDVRKPSKPPHRKRVITGREVRAMLRALGYVRGEAPIRSVGQAVAQAFLLALATGMRSGEVCGLRWEDVRGAYGTAHNVKAREAGVSRDVPFSPVARRIVERMRGWDDVVVFGVSAGTRDALFRRARDRAGLSGFTWHDARHTAATRMAQKLHVLDLCRAFGWSNINQAQTYYNPTAEQIAWRL